VQDGNVMTNYSWVQLGTGQQGQAKVRYAFCWRNEGVQVCLASAMNTLASILAIAILPSRSVELNKS
jgi:hypothetical protein